jgi:hypothetical protein
MEVRILLAGLLVSMMVVEVSAQRAEYDDMYFRGKDREKNKSINAEEAYASAKTKKQKPDEVFVEEEKENVNPTDSYSARNVNPEYVSRSNSEKASEDEANYYLEGYTPPASSTSNFNNSYYNNATQASNSYYANESLNNPYYGGCACNSSMSPAYGWGTGLSVSLMFGNYSSPYGGYGMYNPYYGYGNSYYGGGYGYPSYYGSNNYYNEAPRVNYGKRPSRHSAVVQPAQRTRTQDNGTTNVASVSSGNRQRQRQVQDDYYVKPFKRTSALGADSFTQRNSGGTNNSLFTPSTSQPSRTRESYNTGGSGRTSSYTPSSSPSPSRGSSGSSGGGGGSSPRPRGRN